MEEINLKEFWNYYKKYLIYVILFSTLCCGAMYFYSENVKKPVYSSYAKVVLVKDGDTKNVNDGITQNDITLNQKLVSTYTQIIKSKLVVNKVIDELDLDYTYDKLLSEISVTSVDDTALLKISTTDREPKKAETITNKIVDVFLGEVKEIYKIDNVKVLEPAEVPSSPSNIHTLKDMIIAALVGFVISSGIVFVVFYFDDTLRDIETIENDVDLPILAKVFKDKNKIELLVEELPNAAASESIRNLRTNLQFSSVDKELSTVLVTSSVPSDGKSFISANLAISFAQAGKKVLLVDCDLRKGRQHKIFNVSGKKGLSNLLIKDIGTYNDYIVKTNIKNLSIIPRGTFPPNPSELLNSKKNKTFLEIVAKKFDIVILDGAPISGLADSLILSKLVDSTLIVTSMNHTPKTELVNSKKALENVGANLAGIVANNVVANKHSYGGYYYYYGYSQEETIDSKEEIEETKESTNEKAEK